MKMRTLLLLKKGFHLICAIRQGKVFSFLIIKGGSSGKVQIVDCQSREK